MTLPDIVEELYNGLYAQLNRINVPRFIKNPAGNIFCNRESAVNGILIMFGSLNKVISSLGGDTIKITNTIEKIRDPKTGRDELISIVSERYVEFESQRGACMDEIRKKLIELKAV